MMMRDGGPIDIASHMRVLYIRMYYVCSGDGVGVRSDGGDSQPNAFCFKTQSPNECVRPNVAQTTVMYLKMAQLLPG